MAAFSTRKSVTIPATRLEGDSWGWEPHETVTIKSVFTVGDMEESASTGVGSDGSPTVSVATSKMLDEMILEWNLTDDEHHVVPKTVQSIKQLPMHYAEPIIDAIDRISKKGKVQDAPNF